MERASPVSMLESYEPAATRGQVPLPLPAPGWGASDAMLALDAARASLPRLPLEITLASVLSTVVMRAGVWAIKVYPPGTDADRLERLREALDGVGSIVDWAAAPVGTPYGVVTLMPWIDAAGEIDWPELGVLLRTFHDEARTLDVAPWAPLSRLPAQALELRPDDAAILLGARAELLTALDGVTSELGVGVLHGDVSLSNALRTTTGPRLIDPDWVARGPLEYDLASAARRRARGEIDRATYRRFCAAYGHDVRHWDGLALLDRIADLGALAFALWDSRRRGEDLDWCAPALAAWRTPL